MRIDMPSEQHANPLTHLAGNYAGKLVTAAFEFSKAGYLHSKLSLREFEGARARTAEINGCQLCQQFRARRDLDGYFDTFGGRTEDSVASHGAAPDEAFYKNVSKWREALMYSERERVAIAFAEGLGLDPHGMAKDEAFWKRVKAAFSDEEIVDLSCCVAGWMGMGRVAHVLGLDTVCAFVAVDQVA